MVKENVTDETPRERFLRLASQRTQAILDKCRILGHCSNPYLYDYTEEDIRKIFKTLNDQLSATRLKFSNNKDNKKFSLREQRT